MDPINFGDHLNDHENKICYLFFEKVIWRLTREIEQEDCFKGIDKNVLLRIIFISVLNTISNIKIIDKELIENQSSLEELVKILIKKP